MEASKIREISTCLHVFGAVKDFTPEVRVETFWVLNDLLLGGTDKHLHRNPWADKMILELCRCSFIGFSGCASSGKSAIAAAYAIFFWWSDPTNTKVMVTSTDLRGARNRIWGQVKEFFLAAHSNAPMPGRIIDSLGLIVMDSDSDSMSSNRSGLEIFAGEAKKATECIQKWIGIKNKRVVLILDEMPYLAPQLLAAAESNLISNPFFQLVGLGNFASKLDLFGQFCTPRDGWDAVDIETDEWITKFDGIIGKCVRFDGTKSPNVLAGRNEYPSIYSIETYERHKALGENNPRFWQMCRSFPSPTGIGNTIYSEAHFDKAFEGEPVWMTRPTTVAALDPSFTNGGDRTQMIVGKIGQVEGGRLKLWLSHYEELYENAAQVDVPRDYQIARLYRDKCKKLAVKPENAGTDATGTGKPFHSILLMEWSPDVLPIVFGGSASERPSGDDGAPGSEVYHDRSAELWDQGKEYFVNDLVCGLTKELAQELCSREYDKVGYQKIKIESKRDMKKRIGKSPDLADAFLILLELCRIQFDFYPSPAKRAKSERKEPFGDEGYFYGIVNIQEIVQPQGNGSATKAESAKQLDWWQEDVFQGREDRSDIDRFVDFGISE